MSRLRWGDLKSPPNGRSARRFLMSQHLIAPATWLDVVTVGWLIDQKTGSTLSTGLGILLRFGPQLLWAPGAGRLIDRLPARRLVLATQALQTVPFLLSLAVSSLGTLTVGWLYVHTTASGALVVFASTTRSKAMLAVVGPEQFRRRYAAWILAVQILGLGGGLVGSSLLQTAGSGACFALGALLHAAAAVGFLGIDRDAWRDGVGDGASKGWHAMVRHVLRERRLRVPLLALGLLNLFAFNYGFLLPSLTRDTWQGSASTYRMLIAWWGIGTATGAFATLLVRVRPRTLAVAAMVVAVSSATAAVAPWLHLQGAALCGLGAAQIVLFIGVSVEARLRVDQTMQGRIGALIGIFEAPMGIALLGALAEHTSMRHAFVVSAVAAVPVAVWLWVHARREQQPA